MNHHDDAPADKIDITDFIKETFSDDRWRVAYERAEREFDCCVVDYESDEFVNEVIGQLKKMVLDDTLRDLEAGGFIRCSGVDDDGDLIWESTGKDYPDGSD